MTFVTSKKSTLSGTIVPPSSKSHSIRSLLFGALADGTSTIEQPLNSPDIIAMENVCRIIGADIDKIQGKYIIRGVSGKPKVKIKDIDVANSGQILRFMTAVLALQETEVILSGDASANRRPMQPLIDAINALGGKCYSSGNNGYAPIKVCGTIMGGRISVLGQDSQHISALLMSLPFAKYPSTIQVESPGEKPWIELTLSWLDKMAIKYTRNKYDTFKINGGTVINGFDYTVPADFSSMAFPLVAALITNSSLTINNLDFSDHQGDKVIIDICREMGANFIVKGDMLKVLPSELKGITIDLNKCIDALPIMCVLATSARGETILNNIRVARTKECDRLHVMTTELTKLGVDIQQGDDFIKIRQSKLHGGQVSSYGDHRVAMALIIAGFAVNSYKDKTTVLNTECIDKSYPNFFSDIRSIGCKVE